MKTFLIFLLLIFTSMVIFPGRTYAAVLFEDDFEDGIADGWTSVRGPDNWEINEVNGSKMFGARIDISSTIIDSVSVPIATSSYQIEFDYLPVTGVDRNLDFRWVYDPIGDNYNPYEVHFLNDNPFWTNFGYLGLGPGQTIPSPVPLVTNQMHHIKVILNNQHIQFFLDDVKIVDHKDPTYVFSSESIGLRLSTGAFAPSEGWFDNVVVTTLDHTALTDFKQTDPDWSTQDSNIINLATRLNHNPICGDMYTHGCAVTSIADVFNSYGNITLLNNAQLNPGSLNDWLSDHFLGFDACSIYWNTPSASIGIAAPEIINLSTISQSEAAGKIDAALDNGDLPILGIFVNNDAGTHFLVVSERLSDVNGQPDYKLIDPALYPFVENDAGNSGESLTDIYGGFDNVFRAIIYKKGSSPQNTLAIGAHSPVQLLITDPQGSTTGYNLNNEEIIENIPESSYGVEPGIVPIDGSAPVSGEKKYFQLTNPIEGEYTIQVISTGSGDYTLGFARTDMQSNVSTQLIEGIAHEGIIETYKFQYYHDTSNPLVLEKNVTFGSLIDNISALYESGEISNSGIYNSLLAKANAALFTNLINTKAAKNILKALSNELNAQRGKKISEVAYQILKKDIEALIKRL